MDREAFRHVLEVARIRLKEDELEDFLRKTEEIFNLLEKVREISFGGEESREIINPLRKDEVKAFEEDLLSVFPARRGRYLEVPKNL